MEGLNKFQPCVAFFSFFNAKISMFCIKQWNSHYNVGDDSPMVGIVVTISPSLSLYKMVVFPAASSPTIRILISFFPNNLLKRLAKFPILSHLQEEKLSVCKVSDNVIPN